MSGYGPSKGHFLNASWTASKWAVVILFFLARLGRIAILWKGETLDSEWHLIGRRIEFTGELNKGAFDYMYVCKNYMCVRGY